MGNPTKELRAKLDESRVEWWPSDDPQCEDIITHWRVGPFQWTAIEGEKDLWLNAGIAEHEPLTPEQAIAATVGPTLDQDLQQALDFMRIWITDDAHLGESYISYELEKAEGLRKLEAIEQAIAATLGEEHEMHICKRCGVAYELNIIDKGFGKPRFCPNCGYRRSIND